MKDKLRAKLIDKRKKLSKFELKEKSKYIKMTIFKMKEFKDSRTILLYVSYNNEVDTHQIIKECLDIGKKIVVPKTDILTEKILLSELTNWDHLELGEFNILEPKKEFFKEVLIDSIDLMFIPGIAFDIHGNRIGHGKGYYDKLLKIPNNAIKIGLAFELQIVDNIPTEIHDIKVNKIVTEKRVITCNDTKLLSL